MVLNDSVALLESRKIRDALAAQPRNAHAELRVIEASRSSSAERRKAIRTANRACKKALQCTRKAETWLPETLRLHGTVAWLSGKPGVAKKRWQESIDIAERLKEPVERARVLLEMGDRLGHTSCVEEARRIFDETGAKVDLALSLRTLARMAAASGTDDELALRRYDQAIAALDAVKAEYDFGLACQECAPLLAKCGQNSPPEVRTSLDRSKACMDGRDH